jgi:hypothetical protein
VVDVAVWRGRKEVRDVAAMASERGGSSRGVAGEPLGVAAREHAKSTVGVLCLHADVRSGFASGVPPVPCLPWSAMRLSA